MIKKILTTFMATVIILSLFDISIYDVNAKYNNNSTLNSELYEYYQDYVNYSTNSNVNIELMTYQQFVDLYYTQSFDSVNDYYIYLKTTIDIYNGVSATPNSQSRSSSTGRIWYDIGSSLPKMPSYGKYDFSDVRAGDILYEDTGFLGVTGHIAIVEGWFYDATYDVYYIRLIESMDLGVVKSYLDDERFEAKWGQLFHVDATTPQINSALYFCWMQLGKDWELQPFTKPTSIDYPKWQCSTLVWAAYNYAGVDVEEGGINGIGVTPRDVRDADTTTEYLNYTQINN